MLSYAMTLVLLVSVTPGAEDLAPSTALFTDQTASPSTSPEAAILRGLSDLIFANGFESGTHLWSSSSSYSQFETTILPSFNLDTCNLPAGDYLLTLDAGNGEGGETYQYPLTVTEVPCSGDASQTCLDFSFGEPFITFR